MKKFDVIIVGGGVVGCMIARFLSRYQLDILLIEKESDVGTGPAPRTLPSSMPVMTHCLVPSRLK